jgi:hypothetical protein
VTLRIWIDRRVLAALVVAFLGTTPLGCNSSAAQKRCEQGCLCKDDGLCVARGGQCIAGSTADCAKSRGCKLLGHCTEIDDLCSPSTEAHCRESKFCEIAGRCRFEAAEPRNRCVK